MAVSGGIDSMVLWQVLRDSGYGNLVIVHVEHGLRGADSETDAAFVEAEAIRLGTPCAVRRVDAAIFARETKQSVETAARELRYRAFAEVAHEFACPRLFLAHHADDQVETVLMHLFRGAGSRGLAGMAEESPRVIDGRPITLIRPFLRVTREAITRHATAVEIPWREDSSNQSDWALRNRIRHTLLPEIEAVFGRDARSAILRAAALASLDEEWVAETLGELPRSKDGVGLDVASLRLFPDAKRNRLLLGWLRSSGVPDCGLSEVARVSEVTLSQIRPAKSSLPGGYHVRRRAGVLFIEPPDPE